MLKAYLHYWDHHILTVACTTDRPCHMYLLWTDTPIRMHIRAEDDRGLKKMAAPKYCFVKFTELEQNQPGDTTYHTFTFEGWSFCMTRWWIFRATIDGLDSPSNTGIHSDHCTYPGTGPEYTFNIYASPSDATLSARHASYAWAHNKAEADYVDYSGLSVYDCGHKLSAGIYWIHRNTVYFDIPNWPQGANIIAMDLKLLVQYVYSAPWDLYILNAPEVSEPPTFADYAYLKTLTEPLLICPLTESAGGWRTIPLTGSARGQIVPGSTVKWAMRAKPEIDATPPRPSTHAYIYTADPGHTYAPRIVVTYTV